MTVTKRVRFEVLRRDGHACQYCGSTADTAELTVDHVVPIALGGSDDPSNLVTACRDCNAGKSSTKLDGPLVEQVSAAAATFAVGLREALQAAEAEMAADTEFYDEFLMRWSILRDAYGGRWLVPADARASITRWHQMGVGLDTFEYAIRLAFAKRDVVGRGKFAYMAGIIWNIIRKAEDQITAKQSGRV